MDGLVLGLIGGAVAGGATILGAVTALFHNNKIEDEKWISQKLEIFLAFLFVLTAFSFINPTLEKIYHGPLSANYELWSLIAAFVAGIFLMLLSRNFLENTLMINPEIGKMEEQKAAILLLMILLKNIPEGFAAGTSMNITHTGLSYSLLSVIVLHDLFQGVVATLCFTALGLDHALALVGVMFLAAVELVASTLGSFLSQEVHLLMPVIMAFASGAMISVKISEIFDVLKKQRMKFQLQHGLVSGVIVGVIFFIWKELL